MSKDEIIKYANNIINATFIEATLQDKDGNIIEQGLVNKDVIKGLLDLYQKEKEKNKDLEEENTRQHELLGNIHQNYRGKITKIQEQDKEIVDTQYISKYKIREKIKELEEIRKQLTNSNGIIELSASIDALKELLEENNGKQM